MLAGYCTYTFYFSSSDHASAVREKLRGDESGEEFIECFALQSAIQSDNEFIEGFAVSADVLRIELMTMAGLAVNADLVDAFGAYGCDYCVASLYNNQSGETKICHLWQGEPVTGADLDALVVQFTPYKKLIDAIKAGDNDELLAQLKTGISSDLVVEDKLLLMHAVDARNDVAFQLLIRAGADVNAQNNAGHPILLSLLYAPEHEELKYIVALIDAGADIHHRDASGASILWWAMAFDKRLSRQLVKLGAQLFRPEDAYSDILPLDNLMLAMEHNDREMIPVFYADAAADHGNWWDIAEYSCQYNLLECLRPIVEKGFTPFYSGEQKTLELLLGAAYCQSFKTAAWLFQLAKADAIDLSENIDEVVVLLAGNKKAHSLLGEVLSEYPNAAIDEAIVQAVRANTLENTRLLVATRTGLGSDKGANLLHITLADLTLESAKIMMDCGVDPQVVLDGETIFSRAAEEEGIDDEVREYFANLAQATKGWTAKVLGVLKSK